MPSIQQKIQKLENLFKYYVYSDNPNVFWDRKKHMIKLPYENDFDEWNIPTKVCLIQMNKKHLGFYKKEIQSLLGKKTY